MAGRGELGFPKANACSLRELAAKTTLRKVRAQGHTYVDLREEGKSFIFFCTICLAPCYSETSLFDHLKGNLHSERYAAAKITLFGPNPFPFSDGVLFFHDSSEQNKQLNDVHSNQDRFLTNDQNNGKLTVYGQNSKSSNASSYDDYEELEGNGHDKNSCSPNGNDENSEYIVIPKVVFNDNVSDLEVRFVGIGEMAARICLMDESSSQKKISRIWCAWLGKESSKDESIIPEYDFGIVTFTYNYSIGRAGISEHLVSLLTNSTYQDTDCAEVKKKKRIKKSFSDPENVSESLSGSHGPCRYRQSPTSGLELCRYGEQVQQEKLMLSKTNRQELRRQQRLEAEKMCDLCQQKILPGKDVSTLLNRVTGKLACSSRNNTGAFHVYHTSCLIHWILFCEFEIRTKGLDDKIKIEAKVPRKRGRVKRDAKPKDDLRTAKRDHISSVFCPQCQGTGIYVDDKLEEPTYLLSEIFKYKIKISDAHRAWMKGPEILENCSTGLEFFTKSDEAVQSEVAPLKLLHFYRADE